MKMIDMGLSKTGNAILGSLVGQRLHRIDIIPVVGGNMSYERVRVHAGDTAFDIINALREVEYSDGAEEESVLHVETSDDTTLSIEESNTETVIVPVDQDVVRVGVVTEHICIHGMDTEGVRLLLTQAVVLDLRDRVMCIDRENGPWVMLHVKTGSNVSQIIFDNSREWELDPAEYPDYSCEYKQELTWL